MNNKIRILFLFVFILNTAFAGDLVVSGFVKDSVSLEPLIGASVYIEKTQLGTTTNSYGFFSLKMPEEISKNRMVISFIGYKTGYWDISNSKQQLIFMLVPGIEIEEIEITSKRKVEETPTMSMMKLSMKEIQYLPQLFQEDLIKTIQYLPGIQGGTEGSAGMYVRGGSADQNLILLDDVPLYYVNHAGNMISVFDNNTIKDFELYKGAFPARYGGRLSSVLDIRMKEGDKSRFHGEVGLGLLSGNAFIEGPIIKNKASFFFSYRKFWPEYMLNLITSNMNTKFSYGFYDLSAKVSADLTEKDKLMISFYHGGDELEIKKTPDEKNYGINTTRWSNLMGAIKYTRAFGKNIFSNLTFYSTQYNYFTGSEYNFKEGGDTVYNKLYINYSSNVQDISGKLEVDYIPAPGLKFKFGGQFISHWYLPGSSEYNSLDEITPTDTIDFTTIKALEPSFFIEAVYSPVHNFEINLGLRNSYFLVEEETYPSVEPRIMFRYNIPNLFAIKASYAEMVQTIHLLNYSGAGMASDLWLPPTSQLKPGHSQQVAFGLYKTICNDMYEISIEGYYKYLENMIAYKDGASFFSGTDNWQSKLETGGTGTSKGIEFYLQKNKGRFTGWLSYTLSKTDRYFQNKNNGKTFPFNYDRRHSISLVGSYVLTDNLVLSGTWTYGSGYPITLASTQYPTLVSPGRYSGELDFYGEIINMDHWGDINSVRMRSVHHLDLALTYTKKRKKTERIWNFSIYNIYNRQNPYFYYYESDNNGGVKLMQQSYFPIMPSVSYSLKF